MLQRKLDRSSPFRSITIFSSVKTNRVHYCESKLEIDALLAAEFDDDILDYSTQAHMEYQHGSKTRRYTGDLRVTRRDGGVCIREVKPLHELQKAVLVEKFEHIRAECQLRGEMLDFATDRDLYSDARHKNHRLLYRYKSEPIDKALVKQFKTDFPSVQTSLGQLRFKLRNLGYPDHFAHSLIAHGILSCDFREQISFLTEVAYVN